MKTVVPCFGCDDRTFDCHAKCKSYTDFNTAHLEQKSEIQRKQMIEHMATNHVINFIQEVKKRTRNWK